MKAFLFLILLSLTSLILIGQSCDYVNPRYGVRSVKDIPVGTDLDYRLSPVNLFVDIYYPVGSTEAKRPMVMLAFGGGFIQGKRQDMASLCTEFAKRGFVAATIDYRIGFDGLSVFATDSAEIIRAGYRGAQDGKSALRFLKARHLEDSIDLSRVWVGGASAGSIVALATAFFRDSTDKPKEAGQIAPVNGRNRPDLGSIEGKNNLNGQDTRVQGIFNLFGALLKLDLIKKEQDFAVVSYHQTQDSVVPCGINKPYYGTPVATNYPTAYGSCAMEAYMSQLGIASHLHKTWIYTGTQHGVHDEAAVLHFFFESANPILCGLVTSRDIVQQEYMFIPNPFSDYLQAQNATSGSAYELLDLSGSIIQKGTLNENKIIPTSDWLPGMYLIRLLENGQWKNERLIKF